MSCYDPLNDPPLRAILPPRPWQDLASHTHLFQASSSKSRRLFQRWLSLTFRAEGQRPHFVGLPFSPCRGDFLFQFR